MKEEINMKWVLLSCVVFWLCIYAAVSHTAPYVISDPTTQSVAACGIVIDSAAKVESPVATVAGGKICKYDVSGLTTGQHTITATFIGNDPVWGRLESVPSLPLVLSRPGTPTSPGGLAISP